MAQRQKTKNMNQRDTKKQQKQSLNSIIGTYKKRN